MDATENDGNTERTSALLTALRAALPAGAVHDARAAATRYPTDTSGARRALAGAVEATSPEQVVDVGGGGGGAPRGRADSDFHLPGCPRAHMCVTAKDTRAGDKPLPGPERPDGKWIVAMSQAGR
jgi:hypothetical protein